VRDKLLRVKDGHDADIDLAIDDMKGKDFANELEFWCKRKGAHSYYISYYSAAFYSITLIWLASSKEREYDTSPVCTHTYFTFTLSFSFIVPIGMSNFKRLGIIMRNPGKSKHVEIAAVRVGSIAVDLVNLISPVGELYRIVPYCTVPYSAIPRAILIILQYTICVITELTALCYDVPHRASLCDTA
jgi:hypothetical protein